MSLGKLLTSGKSLVGLNDTEGRYEMRPKNLLPKFGSDKNPFLTAKPQSLQTDFSRKLPVVTRALTPGEAAAAKLKETKRLPEVVAIKTEKKESSKATVKMNVFGFIGKWLGKANPLNWRGERKSAGAAKSASVSTKAPVQTELSLEKIKVIRNDLTDADVEVVPVKISLNPKAEPVAQPAVKAAETAELIKA